MIDESFRLHTLLPEYEKAYLTSHLQKGWEPILKQVAEQTLQHRSIYEDIEKTVGIPWWFVGILHYLEWDFQAPRRFAREVQPILVKKRFNQAQTRNLGAYLWGFDLWNGFRAGAGDESEWVWQGTDTLGGTREAGERKLGAAAIIKYLQSQKAIDIPNPDHPVQLKTLRETIFKTSTQDSSSLANAEQLPITGGVTVPVLENGPAPNDHAKVLLPDGVFQGQHNRNEWFVFRGHIEVEGNEPGNQPNDHFEEPVTKITEPDKGPPIQVPKLGQVYLGEPILGSGGHFSWAEATKNGQRIPVSADIVDGIIKVAEAMEEVRRFLGDRAIHVTSWYRDPVTNRNVGGASQSQHLIGNAVDFWVDGIAPPEVNRMLEDWWRNRGGLASASGFTHIDTRGYRARWHY